MMRNVIQISPTYPPNMGGIGHYAVLLASSLIAKGIKSKFLISDHLLLLYTLTRFQLKDDQQKYF